MKATQTLMDEHRVIERVLSALVQAAERLETGHAIEPKFFLDAADFIQNFADGVHHQKEEGVLFEALNVAGMSKQEGPVGCMLSEHDQARNLTRGLREAATKLQSGDAQAKDEVIRNARSYVVLLRDHIAKEDQVLFPMANQLIPSSGQADRVDEEFERIGKEHASKGTREKYVTLAGELERLAKA